MARDDYSIDETLGEIAKLWKEQPNLRLGQLIVNAVLPESPCPEIYSVEDNALVKKIRRHIDTVSGG